MPIPTTHRLTWSSHPNYKQDPLNESSAAGLRRPHTGHTALLVDAKRPRRTKSGQTSFLARILTINLPRLGCFDIASTGLRTMTAGKTSCSCWPVELDRLQTWDLFLRDVIHHVLFQGSPKHLHEVTSRAASPTFPQACLRLGDRYDSPIISR